MDGDHLVVSLHHVHLPKLDDFGSVEYDPRSGDAVLRKDPNEVKALLEMASIAPQCR